MRFAIVNGRFVLPFMLTSVAPITVEAQIKVIHPNESPTPKHFKYVPQENEPFNATILLYVPYLTTPNQELLLNEQKFVDFRKLTF